MWQVNTKLPRPVARGGVPPSGSGSSSSDDDGVGNGGGGIRSKRRRVETRSKKRVVMPSAAVCIELGSTLWPAGPERSIDGV